MAMAQQALGMVETRGLTAAIEAADAMTKAPTLWSLSSLWAARPSSAASALAKWKSGHWKLTALLTLCRRS